MGHHPHFHGGLVQGLPQLRRDGSDVPALDQVVFQLSCRPDAHVEEARELLSRRCERAFDDVGGNRVRGAVDLGLERRRDEARHVTHRPEDVEKERMRLLPCDETLEILHDATVMATAGGFASCERMPARTTAYWSVDLLQPYRALSGSYVT